MRLISGQIPYPLPPEDTPYDIDLQSQMAQNYIKEFDEFLAENGAKISVIVFEPQWGRQVLFAQNIYC